MTALTDSIAELQRQTPYDLAWCSDDFEDSRPALCVQLPIILNAVVSGELIPKAEIEKGLSDPTTVHYSMLRGTIAKPSVAQIMHLYAGDLILREQHLAEVQALIRDAVEAERERCAPLVAAYEELLATVKGECPSLINEDSGGSSVLIGLMIEADAIKGDMK